MQVITKYNIYISHIKFSLKHNPLHRGFTFIAHKKKVTKGSYVIHQTCIHQYMSILLYSVVMCNSVIHWS